MTEEPSDRRLGRDYMACARDHAKLLTQCFAHV